VKNIRKIMSFERKRKNNHLFETTNDSDYNNNGERQLSCSKYA
jgi:hypothetical protein